MAGEADVDAKLKNAQGLRQAILRYAFTRSTPNRVANAV